MMVETILVWIMVLMTIMVVINSVVVIGYIINRLKCYIEEKKNETK